MFSEYGKKIPKDRRRWIDVVEHCLVEAAAAEVLADALALSPLEKEKLSKTAAVHDWDKRLEQKPEDFTQEEKLAINKQLQKLNLNQELIKSTHPEFIRLLLEGKPSTWLQRLLYYIDDIHEGSSIMPIKERLEATVARHKDLAADQEWAALATKRLREIGKIGPKETANFFDGDLAMAEEVQEEIYRELKNRGVNLESPEKIPEFIKSKIEKNYVK